METINLKSIINSPVYIREEATKSFGNREIHRFILDNSIHQEVVDRAAIVITSLLSDNPQICFLFRPLENETLQDKIKSCRYLIMNGNPLCLSNKSKAPSDIDALCKDMFFSEALIEEPVPCAKLGLQAL